MRARFGEFRLDSEARRLYRQGEPVHLSPKAFELLATLIAARPRALAKSELLETLWPGTFVSEGNLSSLAAELRKALGESARGPGFVRTLHGFGYAFAESGVELEAAAEPFPPVALRLIWGDREFALPEGETTLGRTHRAHVWVDAESVSRHHARIVVKDGHATIEDLGSKNGTRVGGEKIRKATPLVDGDEVRLGSVRMLFRIYTELFSTRTEPGSQG